jgi:hypothetical protein
MNESRSSLRRESLHPETHGPRLARGGWAIPSMVLLVSLAAACSRPRRPAEEVNWGQPKPRAAPRTPPREHRPEPAVGDRAAPSAAAEQQSGVGSGHDGGGNSNQGGNGTGNGLEGTVVSGEGAGATPGAGGGGPGGARDTPAQAQAERPPPALPGREPGKPKLSAAQAAVSAKQLLQRARQLLRNADPASAAAAALEAYEQVLPHANSDAECRKLSEQLEDLLDAAGRKPGRVEAVPTRFE